MQVIDRHVTDVNVIKVTIGLVAMLMLVAGIFQVGPPRWSGTDHPSITDDAGRQIATAVPPKPDDTPSGYADTTTVARGGDDGRAPSAQQETEGPAVAAREPRTDQSQDKIESAMAPQTGAQWAHPRSPSAADPAPAGAPLLVVRHFTKSIPDGHADLPTPEQKAQFIGIVLPLILAANEEILQRRVAIQQAADRDDRALLERWARLYRVSVTGVSSEKLVAETLRRANIVPVPIALAQSVVESGWGTSRFARQGNALFGQWAWNPDAGLKPREASNTRAVVRSFPNLFGSVRGYMHNLNTHPRYQAFRDQRQRYSQRAPSDLAKILVKQLDGYAEIGYAYVEKLEVIMRSNDFYSLATARLR